MSDKKPGADTADTKRSGDYGVGLPARRAAAGLLCAVLEDGQTLDEALANSQAARAMDTLAERDRALARAIVSTALRRLGQTDAVLGEFLDKKLPNRAGITPHILRVAACQLLFLDTPAHAAIDLAVRHAKNDRQARHFDKLVNAVLRRVAERGPGIVAKQDAARLNTPEWLWKRWVENYGEDTAARIAGAHLNEAALDLTVKNDPQGWAERLGGVALDTGSVRLSATGRVEALDGFEEGAWWVQDAGAALPAKMLGGVEDKRVADLCAAPGGKSAQLACAGARVTAVDQSGKRNARLKENMKRLSLDVRAIAADAAVWQPDEKFDAVLLDAPCTGTGTLRRHPDIAHLKSEKDLRELTRLQARLLAHALTLVKPGGTLVYCTCSLEPEEGEAQVERALGEHVHVSAEPIRADEIAGHKGWVTAQGYLRTFPHDLEGEGGKMAGIDGFFAARLRVGEQAP